MTQPAIKTENLSFAVNGKKILDNICLSVPTGEKVFIVGANGAGKTTLLRCIAGVLEGFSGRLLICGTERKKYHRKTLARKLTYLPQKLETDTLFTACQFVTMARYPHLSPFTVVTEGDRKIVSEAMKQTGTEQFADRTLVTLSGGEIRQVAIAAALAQQAKIFLLDEPAAHLDYRHQQQVSALLSKINAKKDTTVICVTHDANSAVLSADRIIALKNGKIIFDGGSEEIMTDSVLEEIYDRKFSFATHPATNQKIIAPDRP